MSSLSRQSRCCWAGRGKLLLCLFAAWLLVAVHQLGEDIGQPRTFTVGEWVLRERVLTLDLSRGVAVESYRWTLRKGRETRFE